MVYIAQVRVYVVIIGTMLNIVGIDVVGRYVCICLLCHGARQLLR